MNEGDTLFIMMHIYRLWHIYGTVAIEVRVVHTLSKLHDVPVGFVTPPPSIETVYCFICGRRSVVVARYRMIYLVLINDMIVYHIV